MPSTRLWRTTSSDRQGSVRLASVLLSSFVSLCELDRGIFMNAMYVYLIASSGFFLLGWVVLLLVAYALAFQGDSA